MEELQLVLPSGGSPISTSSVPPFRSVARSFDVGVDGLDEPVTTLEDALRSRSRALAERLEMVAAAGALLLRLRTDEDGEPVVLFVRGLQHAGAPGFEGLVALRDLLQEVGAPPCSSWATPPRTPMRPGR